MSETIESQQEELHRAQAEELQRRDQERLRAQLLQHNWESREARDKSFNEMEELKTFQSSTFDTIARRRLVEDQDTILELSGKIQEVQNDFFYINDSRDFQDAESVRSGNSHVTSQPSVFPTSSTSWRNAKPFYRNAEPQRRAAKHSGHAWKIWKRFFANPTSCSSAPNPQELNPWSSHVSEPIHSSPHVVSENQTPVQDQRCQSGPSAESSVISSEGDPLKNYGAD